MIKENYFNENDNRDNPTCNKLREIAEYNSKQKSALGGKNSITAFASNKMETLQRLFVFLSNVMLYYIISYYIMLYVIY